MTFAAAQASAVTHAVPAAAAPGLAVLLALAAVPLSIALRTPAARVHVLTEALALPTTPAHASPAARRVAVAPHVARLPVPPAHARLAASARVEVRMLACTRAAAQTAPAPAARRGSVAKHVARVSIPPVLARAAVPPGVMPVAHARARRIAAAHSTARPAAVAHNAAIITEVLLAAAAAVGAATEHISAHTRPTVIAHAVPAAAAPGLAVLLALAAVPLSIASLARSTSEAFLAYA